MKKAIILGSSKGIGHSISRSLSNLNLNLILPVLMYDREENV